MNHVAFGEKKKKKKKTFLSVADWDLIKAPKSNGFGEGNFRVNQNEHKTKDSKKIIGTVGEFGTLRLVKPLCHIELYLEQGLPR